MSENCQCITRFLIDRQQHQHWHPTGVCFHPTAFLNVQKCLDLSELSTELLISDSDEPSFRQD